MKYEVEFYLDDGKMTPIRFETVGDCREDSVIEEAKDKAEVCAKFGGKKLFQYGDFPSFTIYENGEEVGGG